MRNFNKNVLSAADSLSTNGTQIDAGQAVSVSFHCYFGDANAAGTFKLQASNDVCPYNNIQQQAGFTVTNWVDIPTQSASIVAGASALLTIANNAYKWLRAVYTNTAAGVQTVSPIADVAGSLSGKYFLLNAGASGIAYYVWLDNGSGVNPAPAGRTAIHVTYTNDDSADTIGALIATAVAAAHGSADFTTAGTTTVTITNKQAGSFIRIADANTGFAFATTVGGSTTVNVNMNVLSV